MTVFLLRTVNTNTGGDGARFQEAGGYNHESHIPELAGPKNVRSYRRNVDTKHQTCQAKYSSFRRGATGDHQDLVENITRPSVTACGIVYNAVLQPGSSSWVALIASLV